MEKTMTNQENYVKQVNELIVKVEEFGKATSTLCDGIDQFKVNLDDLKDGGKLKNILDNLHQTTGAIIQTNKYLHDALLNIQKYKEEVEESTKNIGQILEINRNISMILKSTEKINLLEIESLLRSEQTEIKGISTIISETLIPLIKDQTVASLSLMQNELINLKSEFDIHRNDSNKLLLELKSDAQTIRADFVEMKKIKNELVDELKDISSSSQNIEEYYNSIMTKWYKNNVNLLGLKNTTKK